MHLESADLRRLEEKARIVVTGLSDFIANLEEGWRIASEEVSGRSSRKPQSGQGTLIGEDPDDVASLGQRSGRGGGRLLQNHRRRNGRGHRNWSWETY